MTDETKEGKWRWVNGERVLPNQTIWRVREPNNSDDNEHCGGLASSDALINDIPCSNIISGVCELDEIMHVAGNLKEGKD